MWWDDVKIGEGHGWSAYSLFDLNGPTISENSGSFWVSNAFFGMGMKIAKDTDEGKALADLVEHENNPDVIQAWIERTLLKHIDPSTLKEGIQEALEKEYEQGRKDKAKEIRGALGL